jgi:hypothetical protein
MTTTLIVPGKIDVALHAKVDINEKRYVVRLADTNIERPVAHLHPVGDAPIVELRECLRLAMDMWACWRAGSAALSQIEETAEWRRCKAALGEG